MIIQMQTPIFHTLLAPFVGRSVLNDDTTGYSAHRPSNNYANHIPSTTRHKVDLNSSRAGAQVRHLYHGNDTGVSNTNRQIPNQSHSYIGEYDSNANYSKSQAYHPASYSNQAVYNSSQIDSYDHTPSSLHQSMLGGTMRDSTSKWHSNSSYNPNFGADPPINRQLFVEDTLRSQVSGQGQSLGQSQIRPWTTSQFMSINDDGVITHRSGPVDDPDLQTTTKFKVSEDGIEILRQKSPRGSSVEHIMSPGNQIEADDVVGASKPFPEQSGHSSVLGEYKVVSFTYFLYCTDYYVSP